MSNVIKFPGGKKPPPGSKPPILPAPKGIIPAPVLYTYEFIETWEGPAFKVRDVLAGNILTDAKLLILELVNGDTANINFDKYKLWRVTKQ